MKKILVSMIIVCLLCVYMMPVASLEGLVEDLSVTSEASMEQEMVEGAFVPFYNSFLDCFTARLKTHDSYIAEWMIREFRNDEGNWAEDIGLYSWTKCNFTEKGEIKFSADVSYAVISNVSVSLSFADIDAFKEDFFTIIDDVLYTMYPMITEEEILAMKEALFVNDIMVSQMSNASQSINRDLYTITFSKKSNRVYFEMKILTIF